MRQPRKGQATVEGALTLLLFFSLICGVIEFGRVVYAYNFVTYVARDASRWASVRGSTNPTPATSSTVSSFVSSQAVGLDGNSLQTTTTWTPNNSPGSTVQVRVSYTVPAIVRFVLPSNLPVSSTSQMVILQ